MNVNDSNPELRFFKLWLLIGYLLLATVIYLSLTSHPIQLDVDFPYQDKFMHCLAYFVLMGWFSQIYHVPKDRVAFAAAFITIGIVLEFIQSLNPARYTEFEDMVANTIGVAIAAILARRTNFRYLLKMFEQRIL